MDPATTALSSTVGRLFDWSRLGTRTMPVLNGVYGYCPTLPSQSPTYKNDEVVVEMSACSTLHFQDGSCV